MQGSTRLVRSLSALVVSLIMAGCVAPPQEPIALDSRGVLVEDARVGVVMAALPEPSLTLPGADCLLCIAAAATANSDLSKHSKTLDGGDIGALKADVVEVLRSQGVDAVAIDSEFVFSDLPKFSASGVAAPKRDHRPFARANELDHLIVIAFRHVGTIRPYSAYVATAAPSATVLGEAYLVDASDNAYDWYLPIDNYLEAEGEWKEPPDFPGLTNAFYQVVEMTRDAILAPLSDLQANGSPAPAIGDESAPEAEATPE